MKKSIREAIESTREQKRRPHVVRRTKGDKEQAQTQPRARGDLFYEFVWMNRGSRV